jgi:hypothetical protein
MSQLKNYIIYFICSDDKVKPVKPSEPLFRKKARTAHKDEPEKFWKKIFRQINTMYIDWEEGLSKIGG